MAHAFYHAKSSQKRWGGEILDFMPIHQFLDHTKEHFPTAQHRILHSSWGIALTEKVFGPTVKLSNDREVPTKLIAEQHVVEDLSFIPTLQDWLSKIPLEPWMYKKSKKLSKNPNLQ